ncbi:MAG: hypothetical protein FWE37_04595 [Spirochaetaceae bacterium]|nr:hypothetical protein [Spirochaetaceae bacterium]
MKKILTIALLLIAINAQGQGLPVAANATLASLFPDENLRAVVAEVLGPNAGLTGQRLSDELAEVEWLRASGRGINNAEGIEYLIGLTELYISFNYLTTLNLSTLTKLNRFYARNNQLTIININNLINLIEIDVSHNPLISLDINYNVNLIRIWLVGNLLEKKDIKGLNDKTQILRSDQ